MIASNVRQCFLLVIEGSSRYIFLKVYKGKFVMKILIPFIIIIILAAFFLQDPSVTVPSNDVTFSYVVKYSGNAGSGDELPLLVALHGDGDTAKNFYKTALSQISVPARIILIKGPLPYGSGNAWPDTVDGYAKYGKAVSEAVEMILLKYPTSGKPVLLGFSGGACMAYYQAVKHGSISFRYPDELHLIWSAVNLISLLLKLLRFMVSQII
jgi:hypothetical protein